MNIFLFQSATIYQLHEVCYRIYFKHIPQVMIYELIQLLFLQSLIFFIQNENEQILDSSNTLFPTPKNYL